MNFKLNQDHFEHYSTLHGVMHTYRVMIHVLQLAKAHKYSEQETLAALCAAFIHDMSRRHDNYCQHHGEWAVKEKFPIFEKDFANAGLETDFFESVKTAVHYHSLPQELEKNHRDYRVVSLLKDADALDRIRLGEDDLDTSYLRLSHTHRFVQYAQNLYYVSNGGTEQGLYGYLLEELSDSVLSYISQ